MAPVAIKIPRRASVGFWAALGLALIVFSYVLTLGIAAACAVLPIVAMRNGFGGVGAIILLILGFTMAGIILWSVAPRGEKFKITGVPIELAQHPRLKALVEEIAAALNESIPASVYLVPDANAFVTERGGFLSFGRRRFMGLGLPLMANMSVSEFRAVLAHEFGHFYSGDTRLGPRIYQTRSAMGRTIRNLSSESALVHLLTRFAIAAVFYTAVMGGLIAYWKLFLRLTQLAARQQEYRSDELACYVAGPGAMKRGLERVNKICAVSQGFWKDVVNPATTAGYRPPLADGFRRYYNSPGIQKLASDSFDRILKNQKTNAFDTHPAVKLRLERVSALNLQEETATEDVRPAITLLDNLDLLETELLKAILTNSEAALKPMDWDSAPEVVWLPLWRRFVGEYAHLLASRSFESVPDLIRELAAIGAQIRDPPGTLLSREQRTQRAANLMSTAIILRLLEHGWKLHMQPGMLYLSRGDSRVVPGETLRKLRQGECSAEQWNTWCAQNELLSVPLIASKAASA